MYIADLHYKYTQQLVAHALRHSAYGLVLCTWIQPSASLDVCHYFITIIPNKMLHVHTYMFMYNNKIHSPLHLAESLSGQKDKEEEERKGCWQEGGPVYMYMNMWVRGKW